ncbi:MAG: PA0069 family radical SAM protein [Nevskiales bacterium]
MRKPAQDIAAPWHLARKGRGAVSNPAHRFSVQTRETADDGWWRDPDEPLPPLHTEVKADATRTIINYNESPDIGANLTINPYRGCEHGCIYCFARPTHSYFGLSPGLDFETKLFYKPRAAELLEQELRKPGYKVQPIMLGPNTDAYQPIEREHRITRSVLEVLDRYNHPVTLLTKSALIERDVDILGRMAERKLVSACISVTSLDPAIKRTLEPRTASPQARLRAIKTLSEAGVPVGVLVAPVIPVITEPELETILEAAAAAGATTARYVLIRLPWELKEVFSDWLRAQRPGEAEHVLSRLRQMHGGKEYNSQWGLRQSGTGPFAKLLEQRFELACKRLGLNQDLRFELDCTQFRLPPQPGDQLGFF